MLLLLIALLGLPSMVSATVDHLIVHPDSLANYEYTLKFENHTVSAVLANGTVIHDGQDPCTSRTSYKIGQEYHEADCPAPNKFVNSDGFCDVSRALVNGHPCEAFCQVRTIYSYEREIPWDHSDVRHAQSYCHGPLVCDLTVGSQLSVLSQYDYGDMNAVYKQGISGGWVNGFGFAIQMDPSTVRLNKNECGYWAFIIIKKKSCGNTSMAIVNQTIGANNDIRQNSCLHDKIWEHITDADDCVEQNPLGRPSRDARGYNPAGKQVFVRISCWDFTPMAAGYQDEAYNLVATKTSDEDPSSLRRRFMGFSCESWPVNGWTGQPASLWVEGRGFPNNIIGDDGSLLYNNLNNRLCRIPWSLHNGWKFEWIPRGGWNNYEWYANIPISTAVPGHDERMAYQCILDWIREQGGPTKNYDKDCKKH